MGSSGRGVKRKQMCRKRIAAASLPYRCRSFWLDSGAHTLYNLHIIGKKGDARFDWYRGKRGGFSVEFKMYLDLYAAFILKYQKGIDYYANVDVIYSPEMSWQALKYLEDKGITPVPVIHSKTPFKWVQKHLDAGYKYLGIGGLGQESTKQSYYDWADNLFTALCPAPHYTPIVRTHGFAMTSYDLLLRYPWWSVDSVSWAKASGFGSILVPHKRKGGFTFEQAPYVIGFSYRSEAAKVKGKHYTSLTKPEQKVVLEWLEEIQVPLGTMNEDGTVGDFGVFSQYNARAIACIRFYERLCKWLGPYEKQYFKVKKKTGFFFQGMQ